MSFYSGYIIHHMSNIFIPVFMMEVARVIVELNNCPELSDYLATRQN